MRVSVPPQFNLLALGARIQPQGGELFAARAHRMSSRARLEKSFSVSGVRPIGSHARGTAIRWYSDLDTMVIMRKGEVMWGGKLVSSDTLLRRIVDDLGERYPASTVRKDGLAAVIEFGGSKQSLDLVPGIFVRFNAGRPVFLIPDGMGGWFETSPQVHDRYFEQAHERSGKKLAKVSQLLKWWKHARTPSLPIHSFYIDMTLASCGICLPAKTYANCLRDFFRVLKDGSCGALTDPCGIAGDIRSTDTEVQRQFLLKAAEYAAFHADAALAAEPRRDFEEANRQWGNCLQW
ncbi:hypothetical protein J7E70_23460 [Variovorax paradoxus]|nr:hypothetical protein [Variovorax paradoxus]MBT2303412.1 hypothetical protein [Variovorax paradoxus]